MMDASSERKRTTKQSQRIAVLVGDLVIAKDPGTAVEVPMLCVEKRNDIRHCLKIDYCKGHPRDSYFIGHSRRLQSNCFVDVRRVYRVFLSDFVEVVGRMEAKAAKHFMELASEHERKSRAPALHTELHEIMRKLLLAELNNLDKHDLQEREQEILADLNFHSNRPPQEMRYEGYRIIPDKDGISKVYRG